MKTITHKNLLDIIDFQIKPTSIGPEVIEILPFYQVL